MLLATSLTSAFLEAAVGICGRPGLFDSASRTLISLGATALVALGLSLILHGSGSLLGRGAGGSGLVARAAWSGSLAGAALLLGSLAGVLVWPLYNADILRWLVILPVALATAGGVHRVAKELPDHENAGALPARVMLWVPTAAGFLFSLVWWARYKVTALASLGALAGAAVAVPALAVAIAAIQVVRREATSLVIMSAALILLLAFPAVGFSLKALPAPRSPAADAVPGPRQVILISIDTLRADALSAYGEDGAPTPGIDRLASESHLFTEAYAVSPWTLPSVATMLTGAHPDIHGMRRPGARLPEGLPTLAEEMQSAGYRTAAIGSNPHLGPGSGLARGFDEYLFHGGTPHFLKEGPFGARLVQRLFPAAFPPWGRQRI